MSDQDIPEQGDWKIEAYGTVTNPPDDDSPEDKEQ
jgi:hypothetical protein